MGRGKQRRALLATGAIAAAVLVAVASVGASAAEPAAARITAAIPAGEGRILAKKQGGTIEGRAGKAKITLQDGQEVPFVEQTSGRLDTMKAIVLVDGKKVTLPVQAVLTEARLHRPPIDRLKDDWAIFSTVEACGDICHGASFLLGPGVRARLGEDTDLPDPGEETPPGRILWRSDGRQVVVDGREAIAVVSLPDGHFHRLEFCRSAAYSPDGRLFVRGDCEEPGGDNVFEVLPDGKLRWITGWPGKWEIDPQNSFRDAPEPLTFLADGTLVAHFKRSGLKQVAVQIPRAQIGSRPEDVRAEAAFKAAAKIDQRAIAPTDAAALVRSLIGKTDGAWTREVASSANTLGYRLNQEGKADAALPLFEAAADLDRSYGMPRYNAARVWAQRGDAEAAVRWLHQLKAMGPSQRARLSEARKDEAFKKIWNTPAFAALGI
jgi:hypothetical protein